MIDTTPDSFRELAGYTKTLRLPHLPGALIPGPHIDEAKGDKGDWIAECADNPLGHNAYDVIACFLNLQSLTVFVQGYWMQEGESDEQLESACSALAANLSKLRALNAGDQISPPILNALSVRAEQIEHLSLVNLI